MKIHKQPAYVRILLATGLLLTTLPLLLKEYFAIPDFLRGALAGLGIGLELTALILIGRFKKAGAACEMRQG